MKAVFFIKPLELSLNVEGESWKQGERVSGQLELKNHSNGSVGLADTGCFLALGEIKKVHSKDIKGITILDQQLFSADQTLNAGQSLSLDFNFQLKSDCPITDKKASLYVFCGSHNDLASAGNLQLKVEPTAAISDFLQVLVDRFRFKVKGLKTKKDFIEATMEPPASKEYTGLLGCKLELRVVEQNLEVKYFLKARRLSFEAHSGTEEQEIKVTQKLTPEQYRIYGKAVNQEGIFKCIDEVLLQVRTKSMK